jgi:hypothetical protein
MKKKIKNIFKKYILKKDRINLFLIINFFIGLLLIILVFIKFKTLWLILIFSITIFFIRFRRKTFGIHLTLEPIILFSVVILRLAGLKYALIVAILPNLIADLVSGSFSPSSIISIICKLLVMVSINFFPGYNLVLITIICYIIFNEGIGTILALYASSPIDQVLTQVFTSTVIRLVYLNLFLYPLCNLLSLGC